MTTENFLKAIALTAVVLVSIKIVFFCWAIWELIHLHWANGIALVFIGEFIGWVGKVLDESTREEFKNE